jgi:allantoin racemase
MKILLINPNTSADMTARMAQSAAVVLPADVEIAARTAPRGMPYIASRAEALIAGQITLEMIAEHQTGADAVVIAAFGDPGLIAARELFEIPIVGMAEAALLTACMLGRKFAIVTFSRTLVPWYEDSVLLAGLDARLASISVPDAAFASVANVQDELSAVLVDTALRAVKRDGADVVILAGAPLTGLARRVASEIPVPVIDPLEASVLQAQSLVRIAPRPASRGRFARPPAKPAIGVAGPLKAWMEQCPPA